MSLWQGLTSGLSSAADWIGDKAEDIGEGISDFFGGTDTSDTDIISGDGGILSGTKDINTEAIVNNPNKTSLLTDANGELNSDGGVDGFSEDTHNKINPISSDKKHDIELNPDGTNKILHPYTQAPNLNQRTTGNFQGSPEHLETIEDAVGSGSLMDVALEPGASGGLYNEEFTGPWSPEVYDENKKAKGFDQTGHQDTGEIKQNIETKEKEIIDQKNAAEAAKVKKQKFLSDFGAQVQEIGDQYSKNPYEYKPW